MEDRGRNQLVKRVNHLAAEVTDVLGYVETKAKLKKEWSWVFCVIQMETNMSSAG